MRSPPKGLQYYSIAGCKTLLQEGLSKNALKIIRRGQSTKYTSVDTIKKQERAYKYWRETGKEPKHSLQEDK